MPLVIVVLFVCQRIYLIEMQFWGHWEKNEKA
jgi:hypothetical protein